LNDYPILEGRSTALKYTYCDIEGRVNLDFTCLWYPNSYHIESRIICQSNIEKVSVLECVRGADKSNFYHQRPGPEGSTMEVIH